MYTVLAEEGDFVVDWEQNWINSEHLSGSHLTDFDY